MTVTATATANATATDISKGNLVFVVQSVKFRYSTSISTRERAISPNNYDQLQFL